MRRILESLSIWLPLAALTALASFVASSPISVRWLPAAPAGCAFLVAAAAHAVWIRAAIRRRNPVFRVLVWLICVQLSSEEVTLLPALALESVVLLAALAAAPSLSPVDHLANCRRVREAAMAQLALIDGILPWTATFFRRLVGNRADPDVASARLDRAQMFTELEDAEQIAAAQRRRLS